LRMSPDGDLSSFDNEDIEDAAGWDGDSGLFLKSASKNKLLDEIESGSFQLHDWIDYASRLKARVRKRAERERKKRDSHGDSHNSESQNVTVTLTDRPTDQTDQTDHIPDSSESVSDQIRELESRYGSEIEIIREAREACALSRKNGKMSDSVWLKVLRELAPHDIGVVLEAITIFIERHADGEKNERYLIAIVRGIQKKEGWPFSNQTKIKRLDDCI
jgi:hypothetical protein